ncbi:Glycerol uptake facilitator protein [Escovopsis weberi]|uniref:Glycerol uptake facilitator protein n=1 Tax=Escovopsis weberi TaxID=150374 RepID=A0A0M8N653_ESCWE|nr:Glycerol uptake facilitator protein [Escovopsis weberi]
MTSSPVERLGTHDLELGVTDLLQRHVSRHVVPPQRVSARRLRFESARPRWFRECLAEALGVFFFVFPGVASIASFTVNGASPLGVTAFGSIFQIGFSFALGIAFAIITCAPMSGGHFHPAVTICLCVWQGFPLRKVPRYILSQILGSFVAGLVVLGMYWPEVSAMKAEFLAAGHPLVMNGGPASILCSFPNPNQTNLGFVFMTEFFVSFFIGTVIWACLDPTNPFVSPVAAPVLIGFAYAAMIWGFAGITISANTARDLGTRIVAAIFFGREAFTYMGYAPIAILVNIPATLISTGFYEFLMRDSLLTIGRGHAVHEEGDEGLARHFSRITDGGAADGVEVNRNDSAMKAAQ